MAEALASTLLDGVPHGFMTRRGGVSRGLVAGLQCGFGAGDDERDVAANRALAAAAVLPGAALVAVHQVHSPACVTVDRPWDDAHRPTADALATRTRGILLAIVTADCAPVLFADPDAGVIGAAHAGWRGAHDGVLENTVAAMVALGARPEAIIAAVGPCIAQPSYEVDDGFRARFAPADERFFAPGWPGHWQFDLPAYCLDRLAQAGVGQAGWIGADTYADEDRFYSFRRATHRGEPAYCC